MNKYIALVCLILSGCGSAISVDLITAEGFVGYSIANNNKKAEIKQIEEDEKKAEEAQKDLIRAKEEAAKAKAQTEADNRVPPIKYFKLLSAKTGCPVCVSQNALLEKHKWIVKVGKPGEVERPYHILKEEMKDTSGDDPLWDKYKADGLPFFQLVVDGKVVSTHEGLMSHEELTKLYNEAGK